MNRKLAAKRKLSFPRSSWIFSDPADSPQTKTGLESAANQTLRLGCASFSNQKPSSERRKSRSKFIHRSVMRQTTIVWSINRVIKWRLINRLVLLRAKFFLPRQRKEFSGWIRGWLTAKGNYAHNFSGNRDCRGINLSSEPQNPPVTAESPHPTDFH